MEDREQILEEIERLKKRLEELNDSIIDLELPKNYDKMTKEEKKAYQSCGFPDPLEIPGAEAGVLYDPCAA